MKYTELIEKRAELVKNLQSAISTGKAEARKLSAIEENEISRITKEIETLDAEIDKRNNKIQILESKMENRFSEVINRNEKNEIQNFAIRSLVLSSGLDNVIVDNSISSVGYVPFWQEMGVDIRPNLSTSLKLPYTGNVLGVKKAEGLKNDNDKTIATVTMQPQRFTITETVSRELMAVANEASLQAQLSAMLKGCDKAITKEIYDVAIAGATAVTGMTGYTVNNVDTLAVAVDGDVSFLMPRTEFYKAKSTKVDDGSGKFLANKVSQFKGEMWDGTPIYYSQLFAPVTPKTIAVADLSHITVATFLSPLDGQSDVEVIFDYTSKAGEGQVVITVCRLADVKLRNADAVKKAVIA